MNTQVLFTFIYLLLSRHRFYWFMLYFCVYHVCLCLWVWVCICHVMHIEVKGQPQLSILTFYLVWDRVYWCEHQASWPKNFRGFSRLLSRLTSRMLTWITLSGLVWVLGIWTWCSCLHGKSFTYWARFWALLPFLTWNSSAKIYSFINCLAILKYYDMRKSEKMLELFAL